MLFSICHAAACGKCSMLFTRLTKSLQQGYQLSKRHLLRTLAQHMTNNDSSHSRTVSLTIKLVYHAVSFSN